MRQIQPVNVWFNGQQVQANNLDMYVINDNLATTATFYYQLLSVITDNQGTTTSTQVAQGNLTMAGTDYEDWGNTGDINQEAYVWAAGQLNLILA